MHELSIAISLVETAEEEIIRLGGLQVFAVHLKLGPLSGVVKDALLFSYEAACQGTLLEGSRLVIEETPVVVYCPQCQAEKTPAEPFYFFCPDCSSSTPEVRQGRELMLVSLEIA